MEPKRNTPKSRDLNQIAVSIVEATTEETVSEPIDDGKDPAAVALGRKGGKKGGAARAAVLTREQRQEIGRKGAAARWSKDQVP